MHAYKAPRPTLLALMVLFLTPQDGSASRARHQSEALHRPAPLPPSNTYRDSRRFMASLSNHGPIDLANSSSSSSFGHLRTRGSYLVPKSSRGFLDEVDEHQRRRQLQQQRTWTAGPRPDYSDTTTRDPAIPDNPEGLKNPSLLVGLWEEEPTVRVSDAVFRGVNGSVVGAQAGTTAKLPCVIQNRADHETVSWIRLRDHHLITVGRQTYSNDDRFSVTYNRHLNEWTLHLRFAQARDAGEYVCQLSTHPPMVFISTLTITQASAEIAGGPERYVQEGSAVVLNCTLRQHTQPPEYVFWYHNRTMINFDTNRQVSVRKTKDGSILTLAAVGRTDSGNYTCLPANARHASITLHIIAGDAPAAMQVSGGSPARPDLLLVPLLLLLFLLGGGGGGGGGATTTASTTTSTSSSCLPRTSL
ncbi:uncharacterized protein [Panulirus ornatus]|uniref:uncharacterized protein n=1 Tax=Panulirus ornatus TaxID=150431 RepID=UPI003A8A8130